MTRNRYVSYVPFLTVLVLVSVPLFAQQSQLQTSFLAPAAVRVNNAAVGSSISPIIVRAEHLPYLTELSRIHKSDALADSQPCSPPACTALSTASRSSECFAVPLP